MTGSLTRPAECRAPPALMHAPPRDPPEHPRSQPQSSPPPTSSAERRRPQGPAAADGVALRASLDTDAYLGTSARARRSPTPLTDTLDARRSFRNDVVEFTCASLIPCYG